jgi:hypothetical protein
MYSQISLEDHFFMKTSGIAAIVIFCASFAFSIPAAAQTILGSITGTVKDATGAAVPGAAVAAENLATGLVVKANSDNNGSYSVPNLPAGTYKVSFNPSYALVRLTA